MKIVDVMSQLVSSRMNIAKDMVKDLIESEMACINKRHPDFQRENATAPLTNFKVVNQYNNNSCSINVQELAGTLLSGAKGEKENCKVLQNLVKLYFDVVRKTVQDGVPKAIMLKIVNFVTDNVESELFQCVYKTEGFEMLLDEANDVSRKRESARTMLKVRSVNRRLMNVNCFHN